MELPLDTLLITSEQAKEAINKRLPLLFYHNYQKIDSGIQKWTCCSPDSPNAWYALENDAEFTMFSHDYFHYFGNVIDLAKYSTQVEDERNVVIYLGASADYIKEDNDRYVLTCYSSGKMKINILANEKDCKQKLIEHFSEIISKDLPMYNIKFIFS